MRTCLISLLALLPLVPAGDVHAHIGDEIYLFYELLDEELHRIDLTDGSVEDWLEVLGPPSLLTSDFWRGSGDYPSDPVDLDVRLWLAWHENSGTLWLALEGLDDRYLPGYLGSGREMSESCYTWDACMQFMIDGDHSGGRYWWIPDHDAQGRIDPGHQAELDLVNNRQAQNYWMPIDPAEGQHVRSFGASEWATREPYAAAGGAAVGHTPGSWVLEMKVTPFDDLVHDDEGLSFSSELYAGKTIGFDIWLHDADEGACPVRAQPLDFRRPSR